MTRYSARTEENVRTSDATLVFTRGGVRPGSGTELTIAMCRKHEKPCLHLDLTAPGPDQIARIRDFVVTKRVDVLNVAGSRESESPGLVAAVRELLVAALARSP